MGFESILIYRFLFAAILLAGIMAATGISFRIERKDILPLMVLALFYMFSALFLFWGYKLMPSGIATTIHFMYPVATTIIMMTFFGEKRSSWRIMAIILAILGVYFLSSGEGDGETSGIGILIVLFSALAYALYLVTIDKFKIGHMKGLKLTFYVFIFATALLTVYTLITSDIQPIEGYRTVGNLVMLAVVPTIISNLALVRAIKLIGSTLTSILGAMEPVTAICVGVFIFHETITYGIGIGVALIIAAVTLVILKR